MDSSISKVIELPDVLRKEHYIRALDNALYRLVFRSSALPIQEIEELKKEKRTSTRVTLTEVSMSHLSFFMTNNNLSMVDAVTLALYDIHTNKKVYFIGETA